jgi:type VI secretion system protein ImpH
MEAARGQPATRLAAAVAAAPQRFEFVQAVRLLELALSELDASRGREPRRPVGLDHAPTREAVRLKAAATLAHPGTALRDPRRAKEVALDGGAVELQAQFFGLVGAAGALPMHYTELVLRREQLKDSSLRDFLDLFHHRALSLFYRASRKYALGLAYEHAHHFSDGPDDFSAALQSLAGLSPTRRARGLAEGARLQFAGLFSDQRRSQLSLEGMLSEVLGAPVEVRQFVGQWLHLDPNECSRLRAQPLGNGAEQRLGAGVVLGTRVWDVVSRLAIRVGPLDRATLRSLRPDGRLLGQLARLVRDFVDARCDAVLECTVRPDEVAPLRLGASGPDASRLGWDSWVLARAATEPVRVPLPLDRA